MPDKSSAGQTIRWRDVTAGALGNLIEWYDWAIYGLLAPVFAPQFFPEHDARTALLLTFLTFAIGFVARPFGGVFLSPYGDRFGRKKLLALTVGTMCVASLAIGLTPPYKTIGFAAPLILVMARLVQGVSAGAEWGGSSALLVEHGGRDRRASAGSLQHVGAGLGTLLATGSAAAMTSWIPQPALGEWGWRLPFLLGGVMAAFVLYLRVSMRETAEFTQVERAGRVAQNPLQQVVRRYPRESLRVAGLSVGVTVTYYIWMSFLPTYAFLVGGLPLHKGFTGNLIALILFIFVVPLMAQLSDRVIGPKPLLVGHALGFVVLAWPLLRAAQTGSFGWYLVAAITGSLLLASVGAVLAAVQADQFPAEVRSTGIGFPYAVTVAVFGGTAPLVATALISKGLGGWIPFYVIAAQAVTAAVALVMPYAPHSTPTAADLSADRSRSVA